MILLISYCEHHHDIHPVAYHCPNPFCGIANWSHFITIFALDFSVNFNAYSYATFNVCKAKFCTILPTLHCCANHGIGGNNLPSLGLCPVLMPAVLYAHASASLLASKKMCHHENRFLMPKLTHNLCSIVAKTCLAPFLAQYQVPAIYLVAASSLAPGAIFLTPSLAAPKGHVDRDWLQ